MGDEGLEYPAYRQFSPETIPSAKQAAQNPAQLATDPDLASLINVGPVISRKGQNMEAIISETELKILAHLREKTLVYRASSRFATSFDDVKGDLKLDEDPAIRAVSFLEGWGLVECLWDGRTREEPYPAVVLTALGENYMRVLEAKLVEQGAIASGKRLGLTVLSELWDTAKQTISAAGGAVLAQYAGVR